MHKQSLTCESQIENGYYNNSERRLKLKDMCVHFGEMGAESFLLRLHKLQERNMINEYKCLPICASCIGSGKEVVKTGSKYNQQAGKERIAIAASNK